MLSLVQHASSARAASFTRGRPHVACQRRNGAATSPRRQYRTVVPATNMLLAHTPKEKYTTEEVLYVKHQNLRFSWKELDVRVASCAGCIPEWLARSTGVVSNLHMTKEEASAFARGLLQRGVQKGDRVGVWMHNNSEWVIASIACFKLGAVLVNVNPAYRAHELRESLNQIGCNTLVLNRSFKTSDYVAMIRSVVPDLPSDTSSPILSKHVPTLRNLILTGEEREPGFHQFSDVQTHENAQLDSTLPLLLAGQQEDEPINIQFTSGTTGFPKGATLTHRNILNNGFLVGETLGLSEADSLCLPVPLYHCFGLVLGNLAAMTHGTRLVYPCESFEPEQVLRAVQEEKCTGLHGVPTMFIAMLNHPYCAKLDTSNLRTGIMAGSICPTEVMKDVINKMNMREVTIAYGMTETSPVSFQTRRDDPIQKRVESVGTVHPHVECRVVDEQGEIVPVNTPGELHTKGYCVMDGYWGDVEKTRQVLHDGWMRTGDMVRIDEQGYCYIVGRIKDTIIRGGENIFPREIEEFLLTHPDIAEAYVIGVPDAKFGEQVCVWCTLKEGSELDEDGLKQFCRDNIAHYKVPKYVVFTDEYPLTVTGKVQKHLMRAASIDQLGLERDILQTNARA